MFGKKVLRDFTGYLAIGLPSFLVIMLDWTAIEGTALMSGWLGVKQQAVNTVLLNAQILLFQIPYGFQQAGCAAVGQEIGAGNVEGAWHAFRVTM